MNTKTTLSLSEARKKFFEIAEAVQKPDTYYLLTENGRPKAVMMSAEEFESWEETLEVMREFPDLKKDVQEVERDLSSGAYRHYPVLEGILAKEGYILADTAPIPYGVSHRPQAKRKKDSRSPVAKR